MGAKYVVVEGLPTTGCLPLAMTLAPTDDRDDIGCVGSSNKQSYTHNAQLQAHLQDLRKQYPQALISYADYWNAYRTVMKNSNKYKFKEPFKACCGSGGGPYNFDLFVPCGSPAVSRACKNPAQYINWDGVHLTEAMYKVVADLFIHGGYCHPSFDVLLSSKTQGD
ncbi:Lipase [Macleaya cordata]|uniref:Lipase n=1 Tax=Macleaya cordata TaxID=56857 RepID=A0A200RCR3_MACCD|nr:Lipase [Macleaya cordata]